jgi:Cellulase N-terminal ig-like domain
VAVFTVHLQAGKCRASNTVPTSPNFRTLRYYLLVTRTTNKSTIRFACRFQLAAAAVILMAVMSATVMADEINAQIRLNQVGFFANETKQALLMTTGMENGATFQVLDAGGAVVLSAPIEKRTGAWNAQYTNIYRLEFSAVTKPGAHTMKVDGSLPASSPSFQIGRGEGPQRAE